MFDQYTDHFGGCRTVQSESQCGDFVVQSLGFIKDKGVVDYEGVEDYFIQDKHILEYIAEFQCLACEDGNGKIKRSRNHEQKARSELDYPLIIISENCGKVVNDFGVLFCRGVVDDLQEHVEYAFVTYENTWFNLHCRHFDDSHELIIYGIQGSDDALAAMLFDIGVGPEQFSFANQEILDGPCRLFRLDDNSNEFLMAEYDFRLSALLAKLHYESLGHKQTYFIKNGL